MFSGGDCTHNAYYLISIVERTLQLISLKATFQVCNLPVIVISQIWCTVQGISGFIGAWEDDEFIRVFFLISFPIFPVFGGWGAGGGKLFNTQEISLPDVPAEDPLFLKYITMTVLNSVLP